mmetsp:Transcript_22870/g.29203  ORF Transcript_22870/g.29203 Transcript_22870/m.29203 type:complete len:249 (-) Transcript_22870:276-1022(-)|eukprot:CAMPEP_0204873802 /NCGR_PEP_ID=MMETSP1348-20121228/41611_1 /ASSEMBLY_ACC=CAM_ASM_000700 /TAXON_ID=215587 /ORGANISM="Aplanochytrium stocchinoi, Strain GSBS06" /LENGTH=248 /DNA_ID=CAMNT_0052029307 /DNA_START=158 /DNA_END=901 /DNA_ORIENTATION=-
MADQNDVEYVCPFCAEPICGKPPPNCKMCGNNLRGLKLNEVVQGETLMAGLEKVTAFTRQQQEDIKNRKHWYKEELNPGLKKPETNVKWDDQFATNYQRENNMTVDESLDEIEEFARLANASEFDEEAWRRLAEKYNGKAGKHANKLPVNEMFMQKLQEQRDKNEGKDGKPGNNTAVARAKFGAKSGSSSMSGGTVTNTSSETTVQKGNGMVPKDVAKKMFNVGENKGKGQSALNNYMNKSRAPKKLW